ncbi:MAG: hypothetical protein N2746_05230 [Deltaproteobacteria bacterium]|nr:hypothetical protein [Deltaproteobacteria bacterium]
MRVLSIIFLIVFLYSCTRSPEKLGDEAFKRHDYAMAIRYYMAALSKRPNDERIIEALSKARINYAKKFFIEASRGMHNNVEEWEILSQHLEAEGGKYKIELVETYYTIAKKYIENGRIDDALQVLKKAAAVEPVKKIAIGKIFDILATIPDDKVEQYTETFVNENSQDVDVCIKAASFLANKEFLDKSIEIYDRCISLISKPALREQIVIERETIQKRRERKRDKQGYQPGQWESGDKRR